MKPYEIIAIDILWLTGINGNDNLENQILRSIPLAKKAVAGLKN